MSKLMSLLIHGRGALTTVHVHGLVLPVACWPVIGGRGGGQQAMLLWLSPFISITPSKPLMSSGSLLTLHNCEIFYLLAVTYDPATTDLISSGSVFTQGQGWGAHSWFFNPLILSGSLFTSCPYPTILVRSLFTQGAGGWGLQANFPNHLFYQGHYAVKNAVELLGAFRPDVEKIQYHWWNLFVVLPCVFSSTLLSSKKVRH
jgi:hypothetical protein